jgi:hypothetical protein
VVMMYVPWVKDEDFDEDEEEEETMAVGGMV